MNLREEMPCTYAFIEACRAAFGKEIINPQIKLGMEGAQTFYASENGIEIGTKIPEPRVFVSGDQLRLATPEESKPEAKRRQGTSLP